MIFPSQARKESMALAFAELDKVANPVICEVGRIRNPDAGESDGHSTLAFLDYVTEKDGKLVSIDPDESTVVACQKLFAGREQNASFRVEFVNKDAIAEFQPYRGYCSMEMDLLYLDGWDLIDPESAKNHLVCFLLAEPLVKPNGLVLIDDTGTTDLGKGKLVVPVALLMGWTVLHQGFQTLLRKPL